MGHIMRTKRSWGVAAFAALVLITTTAAPAVAHDELLSSTPSSGQALDVAPETVELNFSADVMTLGAAIIVVDASGTDWAASEPEVDHGTVSVPIKPDMPVAGYEIRWRVVSSDGHPISGIIPFTIGDADPLVRETSASTAAHTEADQQGTTENQGALRAVWVGGSAAALAIVAFVLISFLRRRSKRDDVQRDA